MMHLNVLEQHECGSDQEDGDPQLEHRVYSESTVVSDRRCDYELTELNQHCTA